MSIHDDRDGSWIDQWGCCRVCDGEIPHGHTDNCDLYKMEQKERALEAEVKRLEGICTDHYAAQASASLLMNARGSSGPISVSNELGILRQERDTARTHVTVLREALSDFKQAMLLNSGSSQPFGMVERVLASTHPTE